MKRRVTTTLALALCLIGCESAAPSDEPLAWPSGVPAGFSTDIIGNPCAASTHLTGLLVVDPAGGVASQSDAGTITPLLWRMGYSPRRLPGGEVEVLDPDGTVVATSGRRYTLGGQFATWAGGAFWVCSDITLRQ